MGDDYLLPSIAVVVVGGALITGGRGHYLGMLGGVLLLTALQTLLAGTTLPYATRAIVYGLVVLGAVMRPPRPARGRLGEGTLMTELVDSHPISAPGSRASASWSPRAAGGIGLAIARRLARHGARLHLRRGGRGRSPPTAASSRGRVIKADVSVEADVDRLFDATCEPRLGGLDALINNAGIAGPTGGVDEIDPADWRRTIDIGLTGQFLCARRAVPLLQGAGGGSIVNMSSAAGRHGYAFRTPYSAAKFGVIGFTQSLAKELGPVEHPESTPSCRASSRGRGWRA